MKKVKDMTLEEWCKSKDIDGIFGKAVVQLLKRLEEKAEGD